MNAERFAYFRQRISDTREEEETKKATRKILTSIGIPLRNKKAYGKAELHVAAGLLRKALQGEIDYLTHSLNLAGLDAEMRTLREVNERRDPNKQRRYCLVVLDMNGFKRYNDTHGTYEGDERLKETTTFLLESLSRKSDKILSRDRGDRYTAVLSDTDISGCLVWWDKVNAQLQAHNIYMSGGAAELDLGNIQESLLLVDDYYRQAKTITHENGSTTVFVTEKEIYESL